MGRDISDAAKQRKDILEPNPPQLLSAGAEMNSLEGCKGEMAMAQSGLWLAQFATAGAGLMHSYLEETAQREVCPFVIVEMIKTPLRGKLQGPRQHMSKEFALHSLAQGVLPLSCTQGDSSIRAMGMLVPTGQTPAASVLVPNAGAIKELLGELGFPSQQC